MADPEHRQQIKNLIVSGQETGQRIDIFMPSDLPSPPNKQLVLDVIDNNLHPLIDLVYDFFEVPIVEDHFGTDDEARDLWESKIAQVYGEMGTSLIQHNRLRPNIFTHAVSVIHALPDYLQRGELQAFTSMIDQRALQPNVYKSLDTEEKLLIVNTIHKVAVAMLHKLIESPSAD